MEGYSKEQLQMILEGLKRVPTYVEEGGRMFGICTNLAYALNDLYDKNLSYTRLLDSIFCCWPKFSGDFEYPVPSPTEDFTAAELYGKTYNMWAGQYGELREELLNFTTEELEKIIDRA